MYTEYRMFFFFFMKLEICLRLQVCGRHVNGYGPAGVLRFGQLSPPQRPLSCCLDYTGRWQAMFWELSSEEREVCQGTRALVPWHTYIAFWDSEC